ncbi:hypothetical protein Bbelb_014370 [Branchiostoma belcheri]|nr:hypothetical protein Bbelb_014370 [Branchiostoma belcheri]
MPSVCSQGRRCQTTQRNAVGASVTERGKPIRVSPGRADFYTRPSVLAPVLRVPGELDGSHRPRERVEKVGKKRETFSWPRTERTGDTCTVDTVSLTADRPHVRVQSAVYVRYQAAIVAVNSFPGLPGSQPGQVFTPRTQASHPDNAIFLERPPRGRQHTHCGVYPGNGPVSSRRDTDNTANLHGLDHVEEHTLKEAVKLNPLFCGQFSGQWPGCRFGRTWPCITVPAGRTSLRSMFVPGIPAGGGTPMATCGNERYGRDWYVVPLSLRNRTIQPQQTLS